jgi:predicted CoA-binding protein
MRGAPGRATIGGHRAVGVNRQRGRIAMQKIKSAAQEFLAHRRVAVTGVSRTPGGHGSNVVYQRLRDRGYEVFAVNPNADAVEGDRAYHSLAEIPGGVEAVVIGTRPELAEGTMRECADLGIRHVWMHRGPGHGSVSQAAAEFGRAQGIEVIPGGCPCMFGETADAGHRMMRPVLTLTGNVPRRV